MTSRSGRRLFRAAAAVLLGLLLLTGGALAWLAHSPDALKPLASALCRNLTGYELAIAGPLRLTLGLEPALTAHDVSVGNADWAAEPHLATAARVHVRIDLVALLGNRVDILALEVTDATLAVEVRPQGSNLDGLLSSQDGAPSGTSVRLQQVQLDNLRVNGRFPELPRLDLHIDALGNVIGPGEFLRYHGHGRLNGHGWRLDGAVGPLDALASRSDVQLDIDLAVGTNQATASGTLGDPIDPQTYDLRLALKGSDATLWSDLLGVREAFQGDVALDARLVPANPGLSWEIDGRVGSYVVAGRGAATLGGEPVVHGNISVRGSDLAVVGKLLGIPYFPDGPFEVQGRGRYRAADLALEDVEVTTGVGTLSLSADLDRFPSFESGEATLTAQGPDLSRFAQVLNRSDLPALPWRVEARHAAAGVPARLHVEVGGHRADARGVLGALPELNGTRLDLSAHGPDLGEMIRAGGIAAGSVGAYTFAGRLTVDDDLAEIDQANLATDHWRARGRLTRPLAGEDTVSMTAVLETASLRRAGAGFDLGLPDRPLQLTLEARHDAKGTRITAGEVQSGPARGHLDGLIAGPRRFDLAVSVTAPISTLLGEPRQQPPGDPSIELAGRLDSTPERLAIEAFRYAVGTLQGRVDGALTWREGAPAVDLDVTGQGRDLGALLPRGVGFRLPADVGFEFQGGLQDDGTGRIRLKPWHIGVADAVDARLSGAVTHGDGIAADLDVELRGASLQTVGALADMHLPPVPFSVTTTVHGRAESTELRDLQAQWGASDFAGSASWQPDASPQIRVRGHSQRLALRRVEPAAGAGAQPPGRLLSTAPIDLDVFEGLDVAVEVGIATLEAPPLLLDDVELVAHLGAGRLSIERLAYRDRFGHFSAAGHVREDGADLDIDVQVSAKDANLGMLTTAEQRAETVPRYTVDIVLTGTGHSMASIAASLDGHVLVQSDGGQISNRLIDTYGGDFINTVIGAVAPGSRRAYAEMDCLVLRGTMTDGILRLDPGFAMRTRQVNTVVLGKIDLGSEALDLNFATQPRGGLGITPSSIINPYFKVGGTLTAPRLRLDAQSASLAYGAAAATGGISLIVQGVWNRLQGERNPCKAFLAAGGG